MSARSTELVLLHGFALHSGLWGDWPLSLAPAAHVRALDLPGHGFEPWHDDISDLAGLARTIGERIPRAAIVIGWSLGGMVALELARQRGPALAGLVLLATTPRFVASPDWAPAMAANAFEDFARSMERDYTRTVREFLALQVQGSSDARATLRALRAGLETRPAPDPRALATGLDILRATDLRGILHRLELPALVIAGQHDRLTHPQAGMALASALPRGEYREVAGAGHAPFLSHSGVVREAISGFLARLRPAPAAVSA